MKVFVAGASGQLAQSIVERAKASQTDVAALGRPQLDIGDADAVAKVIDAAEPDIIINAAAFTAVDKAEDDREAAFRANAHAPEALALTAAARSIPFIHVSTDYVFAGDSKRPYRETDPTGPLGVYGESKLEGEKRVAVAAPRHAIVRTAWVYSPFGGNFVKTMLRLAGDRDVVRVVADQQGAPTYALDIADGLLAMARRMAAEENTDNYGVFHMTGAGEAVWADFAEAVFASSSARGGPTARVERITTSEFPTPAARPANSRLDCAKLHDVYGVRLPDWRESVDACVERLVAP